MDLFLHELEHAPTLAILTVDDGGGSFRGNSQNFIDLMRTGSEYGMLVYVVTAKDFNLNSNRMYGYQYDAKKNIWIRSLQPLPSVVYNRVPYRKFESQSEVQNAILTCIRSPQIQLFNPTFFNKWTLFEWLGKAPTTKKFIPATQKLTSAETLGALIKRYPSVYLKPAKGKAGKGIMKLEHRPSRTKRNEYRLAVQDNKKSLITGYSSLSSVWSALEKQINIEDYIAQQGIELAGYKLRPYDLRVLVQKNEKGEWSLTGIGARVAGRLSITTHVPRGGSIDDPVKLLTSSFGASNAKKVLKRTKEAALTIAKQIETSSGQMLGEMSMDLGVDTSEQIWFFEANAKPMKFDEPEIRKKSLERIILYSMYLCNIQRKAEKKKASARKR